MTNPTRLRPFLLTAASTALALAALAGCGAKANPVETAPTVSRTAPAPPPAPAADACYELPFNAVLQPTNDGSAIPCSGSHTTETVYVGRIDPLVDGHLLAIDSTRVQNQVADTCRDRIAERIGGDEEARRLSRLQPAWFSPTLSQAEAGALWFRCDLVLVTGPETLGPLPGDTHALLDPKDALDTYGTCGTKSPSVDTFRRVACSEPHTWRARATLDLPAAATYLDKAAGKDADSRCRDIDARIAADNLKLHWSFEWPTKDQWDAGHRYGFCWTPDPA